MTALLVMEIERECVDRNIRKECDRNCEKCNLVLPDKEVLDAYDEVIQMLKRQDDDLR